MMNVELKIYNTPISWLLTGLGQAIVLALAMLFLPFTLVPKLGTPIEYLYAAIFATSLVPFILPKILYSDFVKETCKPGDRLWLNVLSACLMFILGSPMLKILRELLRTSLVDFASNGFVTTVVDSTYYSIRQVPTSETARAAVEELIKANSDRLKKNLDFTESMISPIVNILKKDTATAAEEATQLFQKELSKAIETADMVKRNKISWWEVLVHSCDSIERGVQTTIMWSADHTVSILAVGGFLAGFWYWKSAIPKNEILDLMDKNRESASKAIENVHSEAANIQAGVDVLNVAVRNSAHKIVDIITELNKSSDAVLSLSQRNTITTEIVQSLSTRTARDHEVYGHILYELSKAISSPHGHAAIVVSLNAIGLQFGEV